jgi:hypothetical protein
MNKGKERVEEEKQFRNQVSGLVSGLSGLENFQSMEDNNRHSRHLGWTFNAEGLISNGSVMDIGAVVRMLRPVANPNVTVEN